jgi:2-(3-amino-3-carboxypropyl)histidine synthase
MGADILIHYGHSCLVPVDVTNIPCLYVFVDIMIDLDHLVASVELNFKPLSNLTLAGTIQFSSAIQGARLRLSSTYPSLSVPKCLPLSPGEVLGCTAPVISSPKETDAIVFVADGRFHLEAIMIANPLIPAFRYDPYARMLTQELYDQLGMREVRRRAVEKASGCRKWGLILGTLGRQGNPHLLSTIQAKMDALGMETTTFLISEVSPQRLQLIGGDIEAFVQVACPRLSIDWGEGFSRPTLTPYEALVALRVVAPWWSKEEPDGQGEIDPYPMDYYAKNGGSWNSSYHKK